MPQDFIIVNQIKYDSEPPVSQGNWEILSVLLGRSYLKSWANKNLSWCLENGEKKSPCISVSTGGCRNTSDPTQRHALNLLDKCGNTGQFYHSVPALDLGKRGCCNFNSFVTALLQPHFTAWDREAIEPRGCAYLEHVPYLPSYRLYLCSLLGL